MNESQQGKRRPQEQEESNRAKKRQTKAPKVPPRDAALEAARECLEARPIYSRGRLSDHMRPDPAVEFATSNPEVEAEAMALFDAAQSKVDFERFRPQEGINNPTINDFRSLWKVCLRVFDWSPVMLISPLQGLKYRSVARRAQKSGSTPVLGASEPPGDPNQADSAENLEQPQASKGNMPSEVIFPPDFSRILTALIVHPCWRYDHVPFILALQYTVKSRVDNREPWPCSDLLYYTESLRVLRSMFDEPDREPIGITEMLNAVQNSQAEDDRSTFLRFLHFLGGKVKSTPSDVSQPQTYLGVDALPVTIRDLRFLTAAVTEFDWGQDSWNCSPDEVWKAYRSERGLGRDEIPDTNADTKRYTLRSLYDVYRGIASRRRGSRVGASLLQAPQQGVVGDCQEDIAHEEGADIPMEVDIPIDDRLQPPPEDTMETSTGNVSDVPRQSTPFYQKTREREPRRKALVDGEETEDEEEDLQRNQRSDNLPNERQVMQGARRRDRIDSGMMSGQSFAPSYSPYTATTSFPSQPHRLMPLTPVASGMTLSQRLNMDEEILESRFLRSETNIKTLKDENNRILNTQKSHSEAISNLQRRIELQARQPNEPESGNFTETNQELTVLENENSSLVQRNQGLQDRIDQMVKDAKEQSEKMKALEAEKSTLLATMTEKEQSFQAEISRTSAQQTELSDKVKRLEKEKLCLLGIVSQKEKSLAIELEKVRSLEAQLNSGNDTQEAQEEVEQQTEGARQPPIRLPEMMDQWSEEESDVDASVHGGLLGSWRTRNSVVEAFSDRDPQLRRLGQRNY
ncbi:uncharacterized protein FFE2_08584 [Fusarium fujikuroi]|uniref:Uncharacterized protein n=1 Tax=Fusarium fujikuroi TaxID=5127 RepID=A0A9Q9UCS9_FUSFU|nr:uncharacterized protein FFE2_08584 [Fusarium fujikuroi]VTT74595.1 unnamed protein product [Fusarium fujikuroi]